MEFSPQNERAIVELLSSLPERRACIMPLLDLAQRQFGSLSPDVLQLVALRLELPPEQIMSTASFYSMYNRQSVGTFHIQVCRNVSCYLRGGDELLSALQDELGIGVGETSADGMFTLSTVECLASCGTAPALQVNDTYHEEMDRAKVLALLTELRGGRE
jgi:NADH-quinone oxidoreductase subunit E